MIKQRQKTKTNINYRKFDKQSDSEDDETELFTLQKSTPKKQKETVDKVVEDGDTLQSLAIRYCCTIEDLKRLNNIHKENEIFAKRTIKVPHHPISMALAGVHISGRNSPNEPETSKETELNEIIFNSNIQKTVVTEKESSDEDDEEVNLLPQISTEPAPAQMNFNDRDISLKALILCIVILIFAAPLIYVFYIAEHPEQYHHKL